MRKHCPECDLLYLENQGDPWFFQLFIDRGMFILPLIAALFFGLHRAHLPLFIALCVALLVMFVLTTPHRYGLCVALDYYSRLRWGAIDEDEVDAAPGLPAGHDQVVDEKGNETQ
jgi:hypothetical protein